MLFFISAVLLMALITLVSDQVAFANVTDIVRRQSELFEGFFYSLIGFTFIYILIVFAYVSRMRFIERLFALMVCLVSAGNTLFSFALLYGGLGLKREGIEITPSAFDAVFFSAMVFSGNGWADFSPSERTYSVVAIQSVTSYIFVPLLLSALVLMFDKRSSSGVATASPR